MTTVLSLIKQFCMLDFVERNCEKALLLLTRDITWYGTSDAEDVASREEARRYISDEIRLLPTPYTITFLDEKVVPTGDSSGVGFLRVRMTNAGVTVVMRITATSKPEDGAEKLCSMHFSVADSAQEPQEYFPVCQGRKRMEHAREELVMSTMPGGMMGGYCEPEFPFYFINARMLEYLGYVDEAEFVADIAGKISNCMHTEDRERVERTTNEQLSAGEQYTVDYRMKKKDGSYIWVHDIGRQIMTEDGRQAIISVCYDINEDYAKQIQLENLVNAVPCGMALYRLTGSELELLYQSDGVGVLTGRSPEEYATLAKNDIRCSIHPEDTDRCYAAIFQAAQTDHTVAIDYRVPHKDGGYVWISGSFRKTRVENGCPIIHAVFTEMPQLHELMYDITENSDAAIVVTDKNTRELLYINKAVSDALDDLRGDYSGRKCYEYLLQRTDPCEFCDEIMCDAYNGGERELHIPETDHHYLVRGHMANWAGHEARVEYLLDISETRRAQQKLVEIAQNVSCGLCVAIARPPEYKLDYQFINDSFCELLEYPKEEVLRIIKKDLSYGIHPEDRHLVDEMRRNILAGSRREDMTYRYVLPDGRVKWINDSIHALPSKDGSMMLYSSFFDVTEQKRQEQQLDELVNNITAGVAVRSIDNKAHTTHVIYVNQGLCNLLESTEQELCDRFEKDNGSYVDATGRQVLHNMAVALRNGDTHAEGTLSCLLPSGRLKWMHLDVNTVPQLNGTITTYTTYSDMTTQVEQQTQLEDVIRNVPGGICMYRWDGVRLEPLVVSEQFSQLLGEDAYAVLTRTHGTDFIHTHPDDLPALKQAMAEGFQKGSITHVYRSRNSKTNTYLWIQMCGVTLPQADGTQLAYVSYTDITAERQMAQKLRASEMALETATEHAGLWYWKFDTDTGIAYFGARCIADFDVPAELDNYPESWLEKGFILPEYHKPYATAVARICAGTQEVTFETQLRFKDGVVHWAEFRLKRLPQEDGSLSIAVCTSRLIDAQKLLESRYALESQKPSLGQTDLLFHAAFDLATGKTMDYVSVLENRSLLKERPTLEKTTRQLAACIVGNEMRSRFEQTNTIANLLECAQRGENRLSMDFRRRLSDGRILWVRNLWSLVRNPATGNLVAFEYCYNIHAQKMVEEMLWASSTFDYYLLAGIYATSGKMSVYAAARMDLKGQFISYAETRERFVQDIPAGEEREDFLRKSELKTVAQHVEKDGVYFYLCKSLRSDGTLGTFKVHFAPYDLENRIYIMTMTDITDLLAAEKTRSDQMLQALEVAQQANRAKTEFLSSMSHDIRTPMNAIMGMCDLALSDEQDDKQVHESLEVIKSSASLLLSLINNILDMSRIESGKMKLSEAAFSLSQEAQQTERHYRVLAQQKNQTFRLHLNVKHDALRGDVARLHSALDNILANAIKYTPEGGTITYRITETASDKAGIGWFRFEISDTGIGIPPEKQAHTFEPFYRSEDATNLNAEGSGLGLSISKAIVDLKGGTISVQSAKGIGSTFVVVLPLHLADVRSVADERTADKPSIGRCDLSGIHVLLCEDHPINQKVVSRILEKANAKVTVASDGKIGVDQFQNSDSGTYQLILMDIRMPNMDGFEAAKAIRESGHPQGKTIPIIALSANAFNEDVQMSLRNGMNAHLSKPVIAAQLYETILQYTSRTAKQEKVLLVDDTEVNLAVLISALQSKYELLTASNGAQALVILEQHPDISAVLTDIQMPEMDGVTLIKTIRAQVYYRDIAILAVTQYGEAAQETELRKIGADDFLYKPTMPEIVRQKLQEILDNAQG